MLKAGLTNAEELQASCKAGMETWYALGGITVLAYIKGKLT